MNSKAVNVFLHEGYEDDKVVEDILRLASEEEDEDDLSEFLDEVGMIHNNQIVLAKAFYKCLKEDNTLNRALHLLTCIDFDSTSCVNGKNLLQCAIDLGRTPKEIKILISKGMDQDATSFFGQSIIEQVCLDILELNEDDDDATNIDQLLIILSIVMKRSNITLPIAKCLAIFELLMTEKIATTNKLKKAFELMNAQNANFKRMQTHVAEQFFKIKISETANENLLSILKCTKIKQATTVTSQMLEKIEESVKTLEYGDLIISYLTNIKKRAYE